MPWNVGLVLSLAVPGLWTPVLATTRFYRILHDSTLGYVIQGRNGAGSGSRSWISADGLSWAINTTTNLGGAGSHDTLVILDGGLIGFSSGLTVPSTIRTSVNAITYTTRATSSTFEYHTLIPGSPNIALIRSGTTNTNLGDSTNGGVTWNTSSIGTSAATRPTFYAASGPFLPLGARIGSTWFAVGGTKANETDVGLWAGTSTNGTTWTAQTSPIAGIGFTNQSPGVWAVNGEFFVAKRVSGVGPVLYRSSTGATGSWTQVTTLPITSDVQMIMKMLYTANKYVVVMGTTTAGIGTAASEVYTSSNLASWTPLNIPIVSTQTLVDAAWDAGTLVVLASNAANIRYAADVVGEVFTFTGLS